MIIENEKQLTEAVVHEMRRTENPRFRQILESLVRHLHGFAREIRLTEEEFDAAIKYVTALGQHTSESHNETRLMAGSLGLSSLVCLLNNGDHGQAETSANLLGPFWREGAPWMPNGGSIVRSETHGTPLFFKGFVKDKEGRPITDAVVEVWHASPLGLYENQDPEQAEMNLRGKFRTDANGIFAFRSIKPAGYPVPIGGPVGELLRIQKRHPFRPAHLHALIHKQGYKTMASQIYTSDDPNLDSDAQFGVTKALIGHYQLHENEPAPDPDLEGNWYSLEHHFVLESGKSWLPTPPVSAKTSTKERRGTEITSEGMETWMRAYFDACNSGDPARIAEYFEADAVHYFPPHTYEGPFRGALTIGRKWQAAVQNFRSFWTVDQVICDPSTRRAVVEWTHFKRNQNIILRGDEWYVFSEAGLIQEIRAYYASPQDVTIKRLEIEGFDYAGRGYPIRAPEDSRK